MNSKFKSVQDKTLNFFDNAKINQNNTRKSASKEIKFEMKIIAFWDCKFGQPRLTLELFYATGVHNLATRLVLIIPMNHEEILKQKKEKLTARLQRTRKILLRQ